MDVVRTDIEGLVIIQTRLFKDQRGYFFESFSEREFAHKVAPVSFVQDNESKSSYGVLRGLHFQKPPYEQAKLVRVVKGRVLDVAVDLRISDIWQICGCRALGRQSPSAFHTERLCPRLLRLVGGGCVPI